MSDANGKPPKKLVRYTLSKDQESILEGWQQYPSEEGVEDADRLRTIDVALMVAAETIMQMTPQSRQQSKALTHLKSARKSAGSAITAHECMAGHLEH